MKKMFKKSCLSCLLIKLFLLLGFGIAYASNGIGFLENLQNFFEGKELMIIIIVCPISFIGLIILLVKMARDERLHSSEWFFIELSKKEKEIFRKTRQKQAREKN